MLQTTCAMGDMAPTFCISSSPVISDCTPVSKSFHPALASVASVLCRTPIATKHRKVVPSRFAYMSTRRSLRFVALHLPTSSEGAIDWASHESRLVDCAHMMHVVMSQR